MSLTDRIASLCDLLLGAAYADDQFKDREREEVREMLADVLGATITPELEKQIAEFKPAELDLQETADAFADHSEDDRRRLLYLVAAINDADDEVDLREDDYLRALAKALALPATALAGMTVDVEVDELRADFDKVRKVPPPPPKPAKK